MKRTTLARPTAIQQPSYDRQTSIEEFENHEKTINDQFALKNEMESMSEDKSDNKPLSSNDIGGGDKQTLNN